jgi:pyruvate dehydrogenase E2 component (dihydrolipoamide acetyltransferase)
MSETGPGESFSPEGARPEAAGPSIRAITMPKWGLAMEEGALARWAIEEGSEVAVGQEIMDIETTKIANVFESPVAGVLRRKVVQEGETVPVGALLGVVSDSDVADADVERFVRDFLESFKPVERGDSGAPVPETVDAGGTRIRRLKAGPDQGTPLLLIHGFGADLTGWMFNQADLAADRPVHAIDLPGHGGSSKTVGDGSVPALATSVLAYMDAADIERAHLVGHSLGGAIAARIAAEAPDRVAALTLVAPVGLGEEISQDFIDGFITESRARKLRAVLEMLVADPRLISADMVEEVLKFKRLDGAIDALKAITGANFSAGRQTAASMRDVLASLTIPVQVIWGAGDRVLPARHADGLPQSVKVVRIENAGHIPHMERAADVNAAIRGHGPSDKG